MAVQKRNISFFLVLLTFIVLGAGGYFIYDQYQAYSLKQNELALKQDQTNIQRSRKVQLESTIDNFKKSQDTIETLNEIVPSRKNIPELLYQLEAIAVKESGASFKGVSLNETGALTNEKISKDGLSELSVTVQIEGTYSSLKRYIAAVEKNIRITDISSVQFSRIAQSSEGGPEVFDFKIGMIVYYLGNDETK